jgi:hypothetical protein
VTKSLNVIITTIGVEIVVTPSTNVVRGGILTRSVINLGHGLSTIYVGRNLIRCLRILVATTRVIWTPQMVLPI